MLKLERQRTSAVDEAIVLTELKLNLYQKNDEEMDARMFLYEIKYIYEKCESYLDVYRAAYEDVKPHLWMSLNENLSWPLIFGSAEKIKCMFTKKIIDTDSLLDEPVLVNSHMSESERRKRWQNTTVSLEPKWTQLFQAYIDKNMAIPNFQNLRSWYLVCLEHQHQWNEIFPIIRNMWSDDISVMLEQNVKALLICKTNIDWTRSELYEKIKSNTVLMENVLGTDRYH